MRGEFVSKIPIGERITMLATTDLCISLFSVLRSKKPTCRCGCLPSVCRGGRPRTVPGYGRRGPLPGQAISFSELSARIRALIRRCQLPSKSVLIAGDLKLDRCND